MRKAFIISGIVFAALTAASISAAQTEYYDTFSYYTQRLNSAKQHCGSDKVLWLDTKTGQISQPGTNGYGTTEQGRYFCENEGKYGGEGQTPAPQPQPPATQPK